MVGTGIEVDGGTGEVSYNGAVIGTISGGANGADLIVDFTSTDATLAAVEALIEAVQYLNSDANPDPTRTFNFVVDDGAGGVSAGNGVAVKITGIPGVNETTCCSVSTQSARSRLRKMVQTGTILSSR